MISVKWMKKKVALKSHSIFEENDDSDEEEDSDSRVLKKLEQKRKREENALTKEQRGERMKQMGIFCAENNRYWEAISKWNEALALLPNDGTLYEMKAQLLMELNEIFPAVDAARRSVELKCNWFIAHQTYGRSLLNIGEIESAIIAFCKALHLNPADLELRDELNYAMQLLAQKREMQMDVETQQPVINGSERFVRSIKPQKLMSHDCSQFMNEERKRRRNMKCLNRDSNVRRRKV